MLRFLAFFLYMVQQVAAQLSDRITDDEDQILEGSAADYQDYSGDLDEDLPKGRESNTEVPSTGSPDADGNLTLYLAVAVGGVGLIILGGIIFCCYRMKKKDEGAYKPGKPGQA